MRLCLVDLVMDCAPHQCHDGRRQGRGRCRLESRKPAEHNGDTLAFVKANWDCFGSLFVWPKICLEDLFVRWNEQLNQRAQDP